MRPNLSVIVPFHRGLAHLTRCLQALDPLPSGSELIVVADGAAEDCRGVGAQHAARVIDITPASGPATARNVAARAAAGDVLVFVDADVVVSPGSLARLADLFDERPDVSAVFGAYDDSPADCGFVSQYKNLSHAFVHRASAADARTFWAGFGAVRRNAFVGVGGFDERFRRPSVEDIDLGYRLTAAGHRVRLDPTLAAGHLKKWTLASLVVSEVRDRGIPWTQLILRDGALNDDLNLRVAYRVSIVLAYVACAALAAAVFDPRAAAAVPLPLAAIMWLNAGYYRFFYRQRGAWFAARAYGMHALHHLCNGVSLACGTALFTVARYLHLQLPGALAIDRWPSADALLSDTPRRVSEHAEHAPRTKSAAE